MAQIKGLSLQKDEEVQKIYRRSWWRHFWSLILAFIVFVLPFFLIYPLFHYGWWGIMVFLVLLILAIWLGLRLYFVHLDTILVVTNLRLINIVQEGLVNRYVSAFLYDAVASINAKTRGFGALIGVGDLELEFLGKKRIRIILDGIKQPQKVAGEILALQETYLEDGSELEAVKLLQKIRQKVGERAYHELIAD